MKQPAKSAGRRPVATLKDPLVWFAGFSTLAAVASAWAAFTNTHLSKLQVRPQVAITAPEAIPLPSAQPNVMAISLKNVGPMTIYNAELDAGAGVFDRGKEADVWTNVARDPQSIHVRVLIAPTEEQIVHLSGEPLNVYASQIAKGDYRFVVAVHISFVDDLGKRHDRYLCTEYIPILGALQGNVCNTPPQS